MGYDAYHIYAILLMTISLPLSTGMPRFLSQDRGFPLYILKVTKQIGIPFLIRPDTREWKYVKEINVTENPPWKICIHYSLLCMLFYVLEDRRTLCFLVKAWWGGEDCKKFWNGKGCCFHVKKGMFYLVLWGSKLPILWCAVTTYAWLTGYRACWSIWRGENLSLCISREISQIQW